MTNLQLVLGALAQFAVLVGAISAGLVWFRKWVRKQVVTPVAEIKTEVMPNGGRSMRDAIDRIERDLHAHVKRYEDHLQLGHGAGGER